VVGTNSSALCVKSDVKKTDKIGLIIYVSTVARQLGQSTMSGVGVD